MHPFGTCCCPIAYCTCCNAIAVSCMILVLLAAIAVSQYLQFHGITYPLVLVFFVSLHQKFGTP